MKQFKIHGISDGWPLALLLAFAGMAVFYPVIVFMQSYPMAPGFWELQDPAVSGLTFVPGHRVLQWELLHNHNFFWSSLRALGAPILASEIQSAPLFPLTWIALVIPEPFTWTFVVLVRSTLIAALCFMLARRVFGLSRIGAFAFMMSTGFALYTLRWLNHPWTNGFLASLLYLYVLLRPFTRFESAGWRGLSLRKLLLQSLAVYLMVTNGFPEAAMFGAFAAFFLWVPAMVAAVKKGEVRVSEELVVLVGSHLIGFFISSPQIFALVDFMRAHGDSFRSGPGLIQIPEVRDFFKMITRTRDGNPNANLIHYFNLIPLFLLVCGVFAGFVKRNRWTVGILISLLFSVLKFFPIWPAFNRWTGTLPILEGTWFYLYLFPLLLIPFGYFAGLGAETLCAREGFLQKYKGSIFVISAAVVLTFFALAIAIDPSPKSERVWRVGAVIFLFLAAVIWRKFSPSALLLVVFLVLEHATTRPPHFLKFNEELYRDEFGVEKGKDLASIVQSMGMAPFEVRELSYGGSAVGNGIATLHTGAPPFIPYRLRTLLLGMFHPWEGWGASMPMQKAKLPYAHRLLAINFYNHDEFRYLHEKFPKSDLREVGKVLWRKEYYDPNALSRAYIAGGCVASGVPEDSLGWIQSDKFILGDVALEGLNPDGKEFCRTYVAKKASVAIAVDKGSRLSLHSIQGPAIVVLNDLYYPGWSASDAQSGESLEIYPANVAFRAVILKENRPYQIQFQFTPLWFAPAIRLVFSGFALLAIASFIFLRRGRPVLRRSYEPRTT